MKREIKIFKSFEEQEIFHTEKMQKTTVLERFQILFRMQQITHLLHPTTNKERKITIQKNGHSQ